MSEDAGKPQAVGAWWWLAALPVGYLAVFLLVLLDDVVIKTRFLDRHLDDERIRHVFRIAYAPLIRLVKLFL